MAQINHNISAPNDGFGDQLRTAFDHQNDMNTELYANKVDKLPGKDLSDNNFTDEDVIKLNSIAENAGVQIQSDWEQSDNTAKDYIKNKPLEMFSSVGSFHYVDLATQTTPLTVLAGVEKKVTNDTLDPLTNVLNAPYGVTSMWDTINNQLDFTQTAIGDLVTIIPAIEITTTVANQTFSIYIKMGIGSLTPTTKQVYNGALAVVGSIIVNATRDFTIDTLDNKDYPAEIFVLSNADATVKSGDLDIKVVRKDINVVTDHVHTNLALLETFTSGLKANWIEAYDWIFTNGANVLNHLINIANPHNVTKAQVGLGNADNTSDVNKLVSIAQQTALNLKLNITDLLTTVLTGISFVTDTAVVATDSILVGFGKLQKQITDALITIGTKQDNLVSGTNIKTINSASILGSGDIVITGGAGGGARVYNVKDYGALGNGVADDTTAIQTTINTVFAAGGGVVYFPIGIYIIGGALLNDVGDGLVDYNSQLYIPQVNFNNLTRPTITFLGEVAPNLVQTLGISSAIPPNSGVILRSTIQGSGIRPSVICNKGQASNPYGFSYTNPIFKNLSIQLTADVSNKLTMGGVNCEYSAIANFEYITVFPYNLNLVNSGEPNIIDVVGIAMPGNNCEHINTLRNCTVGGFTNGYLLGEHSSASDIIAICCVNGFSQNTNHHIGNYTKLSSFWCRYDFNVIGTFSRFVVHALQVEWATQSKWYDTLATVKDSGNVGVGIVNYNIVAAGIGLDNTKYIKIGGNFIKSKEISIIENKVITAQTYTLIAGDANKGLIITSNNLPVSITVPLDNTHNFDIGCSINISQFGDGKITFIQPSGLIIDTAETLSTRKKYSTISLIKRWNNYWVLTGDLELL